MEHGEQLERLYYIYYITGEWPLARADVSPVRAELWWHRCSRLTDLSSHVTVRESSTISWPQWPLLVSSKKRRRSVSLNSQPNTFHPSEIRSREPGANIGAQQESLSAWGQGSKTNLHNLYDEGLQYVDDKASTTRVLVHVFMCTRLLDSGIRGHEDKEAQGYGVWLGQSFRTNHKKEGKQGPGVT